MIAAPLAGRWGRSRALKAVANPPQGYFAKGEGLRPRCFFSLF